MKHISLMRSAHNNTHAHAHNLPFESIFVCALNVCKWILWTMQLNPGIYTFNSKMLNNLCEKKIETGMCTENT